LKDELKESDSDEEEEEEEEEEMDSFDELSLDGSLTYQPGDFFAFGQGFDFFYEFFFSFVFIIFLCLGERGQLGISSMHSKVGYVKFHIDKPRLNTCLRDDNIVVKVSCGFSHSLVLMDTGELYSFGNNALGQSGVKKLRGEGLFFFLNS